MPGGRNQGRRTPLAREASTCVRYTQQRRARSPDSPTTRGESHDGSAVAAATLEVGPTLLFADVSPRTRALGIPASRHQSSSPPSRGRMPSRPAMRWILAVAPAPIRSTSLATAGGRPALTSPNQRFGWLSESCARAKTWPVPHASSAWTPHSSPRCAPILLAPCCSTSAASMAFPSSGEQVTCRALRAGQRRTRSSCSMPLGRETLVAVWQASARMMCAGSSRLPSWSSESSKARTRAEASPPPGTGYAANNRTSQCDAIHLTRGITPRMLARPIVGEPRDEGE